MIRDLHDAVAILCGLSATLLAVVAGLIAWVYWLATKLDALATRLDELDEENGRAVEAIAADLEEHDERLELLEGGRPTVPTYRGRDRL